MQFDTQLEFFSHVVSADFDTLAALLAKTKSPFHFLKAYIGQQGKYRPDSAENGHNLHFAPAGHFKMVVYRAHFKYSFAMSQLEISHLYNNAQCLTGVNNTHWQNNLRTVDSPGHCNHGTAKEHASGVAHKHLCRIKIPYQKACTGAGNGYCKNSIGVISVSLIKKVILGSM